MSRGKNIALMLSSIDAVETQCYLGTGLHTLGLVKWLLRQTGPADVMLSTFSSSEEFLAGFQRIRNEGLINRAACLLDFKASLKTMRLEPLFKSCFDQLFLGMNHSKVVLIENDKYTVAVVTSQNHTCGDRAECTVVTTDSDVFNKLKYEFIELCQNSYDRKLIDPTAGCGPAEDCP